MTNKTLCRLSLCFAAVLACSGGGVSQPTQAILKLSTDGSATSLAIKGVQVTLQLPAGVTIAANGAGKMDAAALSGTGATATGSVLLAGHFTPATSSSAATGKVMIVKPTGFDTGEFATVTCAIAKGASPRSSDFGLTGFQSVDENGVQIQGLSVVLKADIK